MNQRRIGASFAAALLLALASLPACKSTTGPSQRVVPVKDAAEEAKKPAADDRAIAPLTAGARIEDEKNTISVFRNAADATVFVTQKARMVVDYYGNTEEVAAGSGSGFVWDKDGHIVTNYHVVADGLGNRGSFTVTFQNQKVYNAKVVGVEPRKDIAVLKIDAPAEALQPVKVPSDFRLEVGQKTIAIGNPFGLDHSLTTGVISALGRQVMGAGNVTIRDMVQTDAAINPGNSGGPLFNMRGEVVGINSQIYSRSGGYMGISFAIPIDVAMNVATQLQQTGKVSRGRIGVQIQPLTQELAQSFGLKSTDGALVSQVENNGPAAKAGLQAGDVILKFNNQAVKSSNELPLIVANVHPGSKVPLLLWRKGKELNLSITVGEMPNEKVANEQPAEPQVAKIQRLGLHISDLAQQDKAELGLRGGVVVETAEGEAAKAGIEEGDVILAINAVDTPNVATFNKILAKTAPGTVALLIWRENNTLYIPIRIR